MWKGTPQGRSPTEACRAGDGVLRCLGPRDVWGHMGSRDMWPGALGNPGGGRDGALGQTRALLLPGATDLQSPGCLQSSDIAGMCKVPGIAPGKEGQQRGREGCNCEVQGAARGNPRPGASGRPDALTPGLACPPRFSILPVCSPESLSWRAVPAAPRL